MDNAENPLKSRQPLINIIMDCKCTIHDWKITDLAPGTFSYCLNTAKPENYYGISLTEASMGVELASTGYYAGSFQGPSWTIINSNEEAISFTIRILEVYPPDSGPCEVNLTQTGFQSPY